MTSTRLPRIAAALVACAALAAGFAATMRASRADDAAPAAPAKDPEIPADTEIVTTASGLKYFVLVPGKEGKHPKMGESVKVHYTGWLTDGTKFDSSRDRGAPTEFMVGQVIPGWNEALQLMTTGARWKLTIPAKLAYGESGSPPKIPANATLIFDVELLAFRSMPDFHAPDPAVQKKTASGLKYEVLAEGAGDPPGANDAVELKFAFWTTKGGLCDCTEKAGQTVKARAEDLALPFMKEAIGLLRPGARLRFEVPPELCFGDKPMSAELPANSPTIWELELVRVIHPLPLPKFALPDDAKAKTTASGLKYEVIQEGEGASPHMGEKVKVHYAGWLTDGTLFDSSYGRGEPMEVPLGRVIQGWNEVLQLMKPGAIYRVTIPPSLGYGARPAGPKIPANSTLVFYVNLVGPAAGE
jgi:FK506-binding protein 4/5